MKRFYHSVAVLAVEVLWRTRDVAQQPGVAYRPAAARSQRAGREVVQVASTSTRICRPGTSIRAKRSFKSRRHTGVSDRRQPPRRQAARLVRSGGNDPLVKNVAVKTGRSSPLRRRKGKPLSVVK